MLCMHSMSQASLQGIRQCCSALGVRTHVVPTMNQILGLDKVEPGMTAISAAVISDNLLQEESKVQARITSSLSDHQEFFFRPDDGFRPPQ